MKKLIATALTLLLLVGLMPTASAFQFGEQRVVFGADLNAEQRQQMWRDFGLIPGAVPELTVTIEEERASLRGFVPDSVIGSRSISSVYIMITEPGSGLDITIYNINWLTENIYRNALVTAGITDARVIISAPVPVSGTAALTGIYKAFEEITGTALSQEAMLAGIEEAVLTGEIAAFLGDDENITALMNELKLILDEVRHMSDSEVRAEIWNLADEFNIALTADQVEQILRLARTLQNLDVGGLQTAVLAIVNNLDRINQASEAVSGFFHSVGNFFSTVGRGLSDFFNTVFG